MQVHGSRVAYPAAHRGILSYRVHPIKTRREDCRGGSTVQWHMKQESDRTNVGGVTGHITWRGRDGRGVRTTRVHQLTHTWNSSAKRKRAALLVDQGRRSLNQSPPSAFRRPRCHLQGIHLLATAVAFSRQADHHFHRLLRRHRNQKAHHWSQASASAQLYPQLRFRRPRAAVSRRRRCYSNLSWPRSLPWLPLLPLSPGRKCHLWKTDFGPLAAAVAPARYSGRYARQRTRHRDRAQREAQS